MKKSDIDKLDYLLGKIVETDWLVTYDDLLKSEFYDINDQDIAERDFNRFQKIYSDYNVGEVSTQEDNSWIRKNLNTLEFHNSGGFIKKYNDEQKRKEQDKIQFLKTKEKEDLEIELAKSNIEANKINKKVAARNKKETIINIILGLVNIGLLIWQLLKTE